MYGEVAGKFVASARGFNRVDVANEIGDSHVRRGQLFHVAIIWREICDGRLVAQTRHLFAAAPANGSVRIITDFAARDVWRVRIEQRR